MSGGERHGPPRRLYVVVFAVAAAAVVWSGLRYIQAYERRFRQDVEQQLLSIADLKAEELASWRGERLGDGSVYAGNQAFARLVRGFLAGEPVHAAELRAWLAKSQADLRYDTVMLLDPSMRKRLVVPERPERPERPFSHVSASSFERLRAGLVAFEDFYWNATNERTYLEVLAPVRDEADGGRLIAVVALRIDPRTYLYPFIARWPTPSPTGETLLVRREGSAVLYLNDLKFRKGTALRLRIPLEDTSVTAVQAALGTRGIVEGTDYRGVRCISAIRAVPDSPWLLLSRVDEAEILAPVRERRWIAAILAGVLLLAGGAGMGFALRSQSARYFRDRLRANEALRESEDRLRAITESARDAILMMDGEGRISYWNPAAERILGHTASEALGRDLHTLIAPVRYHEAHLAAYPEFRRTGQGGAVGKTLELEAVRRDGTELTIALSLSAVPIKGVWHAVGILRDVSAQKEAERELRRAVEEKDEANERLEATSALANEMAREAEAASLAKSQFLANMSHEIRTPMNGVLGMTGLLLDSTLTDEQRRYAGVVRSSAEALLAVINDILDFSKIEAGKLELEELDFDLRALVEDVAEMLAVKAQEKGLELTCRIDAEMPTLLRGDPGRLRQVLTNLVGNAVKFTPKGEVAVEVRAAKELDGGVEVRFSVRDTGIGVPPDKLGLLFSAFQQVDASTTRRFGGTGLGLAICRRLSRLMGGDVGVESVEGRGSTFWFTARVKRQRQAIGEPRERGDVRGARVLAVDDNATNRLVLSELLSSWGARHEEADGAAQALRMLRAARAAGDPFRVVITDMQMPVTDGESLGRTIKGDPALRPTILVMMTSMGARGDARRLEAAGFAAYLTKPVKQSHLYDCLATLLGQGDGEGRAEVPLLTRHSLSEARRRNVRILLAEDNATNQQVAIRLLEKLGYRADAVGNGEEAIRALETMPYDLVFMDVQMPVMDGLEATAAIRSGQTGVPEPRVPIVAMTAHAMKGDRERCLEAGMDDYVPKPIAARDLVAALERWLPKEEDEPPPAVLRPPVPAPAAPPPTSLPVFDRAGFERRLMGDRALVAEIAAGFLEDVVTRLASLADSVREGDARATAGHAHAVKGASANVGAIAMSALAAELEAAARAGRVEKAAALLADLEAQHALVAERMREVMT